MYSLRLGVLGALARIPSLRSAALPVEALMWRKRSATPDRLIEILLRLKAAWLSAIRQLAQKSSHAGDFAGNVPQPRRYKPAP